MLLQKFPRPRNEIYIADVLIPVFGANRYRRRDEFAKSRGQIRFHIFAACAGKHPRMLHREMRNLGRRIRQAPSLLGGGGPLSLAEAHPYTEDGGA